MKIVYVGDNRNRGNYGCRATSTALSQIISSENEIVGRVYGTYTNLEPGDLFFSEKYPSWIYTNISKIKYWDKIRKVIYYYHRFKKRGNARWFFSKYDFISKDLDKSIDNLIKLLPANDFLNEYDLRKYDFDALVVNGEGSFIFATPPWRECLIELMLMHWALKLGKKVYYLNGMLSNDPYSEQNKEVIEIAQQVFEKCEVVSVREFYSKKYAEENFKNINLKYHPDALFSWYDYINDDFKINNGRYIMGMSGAYDDSFYKFDFTQPYICISGSSSVGTATNDKDKIINTYTQLVSEVKKEFNKYNVFLVDVCEGDNFLHKVSKNTDTPIIAIDTPILAVGKVLANASLYISGRYHPSILASLGGTPCVFMSSNSHKTKSVQELLEYKNIVEYDVLPNKNERKKIIEDGKKKLEEGTRLREKIKERCRILSNCTIKQKELLR